VILLWLIIRAIEMHFVPLDHLAIMREFLEKLLRDAKRIIIYVIRNKPMDFVILIM
jgi:hypothetical protein